MNMKFFQKNLNYFLSLLYDLLRILIKISYKWLVSPFSPSNVDIIHSYFYMSFLNVYYIKLCKLHEKHLNLNEV
jgi:hypothetical protein